MNIKDLIEAGHYPTDDRGRALVPVGGPGRRGWIATIVATDAPEGIVGFGPCSTRTWDELGLDVKNNGDGDLLPPPPRKVKVEIWGVVIKGTGTVVSIRDGDNPPSGVAGCERLVKLSGEYEEPWS
jgi:hypothetical protein